MTVFILLFSVNSHSQEKSDLTLDEISKTHKKIALEELMKKKGAFDIDINQMLVFTVEGKRLEGVEMINALNSDKFTPKVYVDKDLEIKALVLEPATEDESDQRKERQKPNSGNTNIGKKAPSFSVTDIAGKSYTLNELNDKIIVINFWFIQCKPCIAEMPDLNELVAKYKGKDVVFLAFSHNEKKSIESFLEKREFDYNIIAMGNDVIQEYGITSYPTHLIIDKDSKVAYFSEGLSHNTISDLNNKIEELIKK